VKAHEEHAKLSQRWRHSFGLEDFALSELNDGGDIGVLETEAADDNVE
jgi:hypothetical protein